MDGLIFVVDIEITNRCNAKCHFCPRDMTPHQGLMSPEVFEQALVVTTEAARANPTMQTRVNLCGLGEPLLNKHAPSFVRQVREAGFECGISSNASLFDERRTEAVLDAGLTRAFLNVGEIEDEYEEIYKLPWARTRDGVARFIESAEGRCEVFMVLVDHRSDADHLSAMREYWSGFGDVKFMEFDIMNRGGSLFAEHMQYGDHPDNLQARELLGSAELPALCGVPFFELFIGYDGQYYLCCSDWTKEAPLGSIFEATPLEVARKKYQFTATREPVCATCNLDPVNRVTDMIRAVRDGDATQADLDGLVEQMRGLAVGLHNGLDELDASIRAEPLPTMPKRKFLPVSVA